MFQFSQGFLNHTSCPIVIRYCWPEKKTVGNHNFLKYWSTQASWGRTLGIASNQNKLNFFLVFFCWLVDSVKFTVTGVTFTSLPPPTSTYNSRTKYLQLALYSVGQMSFWHFGCFAKNSNPLKEWQMSPCKMSPVFMTALESWQMSNEQISLRQLLPNNIISFRCCIVKHQSYSLD